MWQDFNVLPYKGLVTASDFSGAKDSSVIYDGSPHGIGAVKLRFEFADACSVVGPYYTGVNGTRYAKTTALPTGVGTYSVSAGIDYTAASGFRDTSIAVGTLTIRKAMPTKGHFSIASSGGLTCSYDGAAHTVTASLKDGKLGGLGAVTVKYNGRSTDSPVGAGVYNIAVNITEGENFSAVTDLWLGKLTINKIKPAAEHLSYPASASATYDGLPHAVSVSPKEDKYDGMGAITVKYNGSVTPPVGAGEYTVSADVADGLNFDSVSGLSLGKLAIRYSVTFESSGGSAVDAQAVLPGGVATAPAAPTKASNTFAGWYSDAGLTKLWNFPIDKVTGNMKLYARWIGSGITTYTVSFNSNEGSAVDAQTVAKDGTVVRPANPTKASNTFAGWYGDANFTKLWSFAADKVTANMTLYARWISATIPYTASVDSSVTYDGSPHGVGPLTLSPQFAGAGAVTATYYTGVSGAAYAKTTAAPTNAGVYALTVDIDFDENTSLRDTSVAVGTLTIRKAAPAELHLSFAPDSSLTYDGLPHDVPVTKKGTPYSGMGSITVKYNVKRTEKPVNAGVYDITVNISEGTNFSAATDLWLGTLTINKLTPAAEHLVYTPSVSVGYDGSPHAFSVLPDDSRYSGMGAITVKYDGSVAPPVNAGKYAVTV
ncbi:MAG: InlB B-repeat-containing protein, partial [Prevotellaceae bacterium]|nr:InlB B-repeat-containing protein [Prevotellaceae bacterium]